MLDRLAASRGANHPTAAMVGAGRASEAKAAAPTAEAKTSRGTRVSSGSREPVAVAEETSRVRGATITVRAANAAAMVVRRTGVVDSTRVRAVAVAGARRARVSGP